VVTDFLLTNLADWRTVRIMGADGRMVGYAGNKHNPGRVDGLGSSAKFQFATGLAVDSTGALYTLDVLPAGTRDRHNMNVNVSGNI
jgi:hypothetical protein